MNVHEITDLSNSRVTNLLVEGLLNVSDPRFIDNYNPIRRGLSQNLFNQLENGRFKGGNYFVMEEGGVYYGSAGWKPYKNDIALALTRAYIPPAHRAKFLLGKHILPKIIEQTSGFKRLWITVNLHNKTLYDWFQRPNLNWPAIYKDFVPLGITEVNSVKQYVIEYERA